MRRVAVVGAGVMGTRICNHFRQAGLQTALIDPSPEVIEKAKEFFGAEAAGVTFANGLQDLDDDWRNADAVIEAVPEKIDLKRAVIRDLEQFFDSGTVIASNTSGLGTHQMTEGMAAPERFLIAHFFNPADLIPAVELVPGRLTSSETCTRMAALLESTGKKVARLNIEVPGFIANRLQHAMLRECFHLIDEGIADAETIDLVTRYSLGVRLALIGPLLQRDLNGLDTHYNIASYLYPDLDASREPSEVLAQKVRAGDLGRKTGKGFYTWDEERTQQMERLERCLPRIVEIAAEGGAVEEK